MTASNCSPSTGKEGSGSTADKTDWEKIARRHVSIDLEMLADELGEPFHSLATAVSEGRDASAADVFTCFGKPLEAQERLLSEPLCGLAPSFSEEARVILEHLTDCEARLLHISKEVNRLENGEEPRHPERFAEAAEALRETADLIETRAEEYGIEEGENDESV